jgi:hypothetical protein
MKNKTTFAWQGWKPAFYYTKKYYMLFAYKARLLINKLLWK